MARRARGVEFSRGRTGCPAGRPLLAGVSAPGGAQGVGGGVAGRAAVVGFGVGGLPEAGRGDPPCMSPRNGRSTCPGRWSAACSCRGRGPWGRDGGTAVAVPGHGDAGRAGEDDPVVSEPPSLIAEATAEFFHPDPVASSFVLMPYPAHEPVPRMVVDRAEGGLGPPVPEVVRPPAQGPAEAEYHLVEVLVAG